MFELKKDKSIEQYWFVLKAGNGQVILASGAYNSKAAVKNGIASVQANCVDDDRYEKRLTKNNKYHFNLKARNGQVIGSSQMYASKAGMENGIACVKDNALRGKIKEV
jgi:uncharacterized protein YegP (UPF0339 family)